MLIGVGGIFPSQGRLYFADSVILMVLNYQSLFLRTTLQENGL